MSAICYRMKHICGVQMQVVGWRERVCKRDGGVRMNEVGHSEILTAGLVASRHVGHTER
jgi:hypothetical protein